MQERAVAASIKEINELRILNLIRLHPGISRTEICQQTGLGKATVSTIVSELISQGMIAEKGARMHLASAGRPPVNLELNGEARLAVGIELTGSECLATLCNLYGQSLHFIRYPMPTSSVDISVETIATAVLDLMKDYDWDRLLGVGVGVPGPVDPDRQRVIQAENIGWWDVALGPLLRERLGKPALIVKRNNAGALGEYWYGIGRGNDNLIYVSIGVGIGSGIIIRGELYEGATGTAGEIGHLTVVPRGQHCRCGKVGCLETVASCPAILAWYKERLRAGQPSVLANWAQGNIESITDGQMVEAARQGDQLAVDAIQRASRYLGRAIAAFVNIFNPSMVIIEGRMIELGDLFFDPIRREVQRHAFSLSRTVEILPGLLGYRAAAIGAATLVVDRFFTLANPLSQN